MKKILLALGASATVLLCAAVAHADIIQSTSPNAVKIVQLGTDAMGSDTFANRNREFVDIKNTGGSPVDIAGWRTEDAWAFGDNSHSLCNTFVVKTTNVNAALVSGSAVNLPAGATLRVYTGAGTPGAHGTWFTAYMNSSDHCGAHGQYINNDAEDMYLRDGTATHETVSHVRYNRLGGYEVSFAS